MSSAWQTPAAPKKSGTPKWLWVVGGCGAFGMVSVFSLCGALLCITGGNEGGVRYANNMEDYAVQYIDQHGLLEPGERIVAYYDATIDLDATEAAILTDRRVMYHHDGNTTSMALSDVVNVYHEENPLLGDIIDVSGRDGSVLHIEVAPFNGGSGFLRELRNRTGTGMGGMGGGFPGAPGDPGGRGGSGYGGGAGGQGQGF